MRTFTSTAIIVTALFILFVLGPSTSQAGDFLLSNNSGSSSTTWFISGESSLVINGFDLQPLGITRPVGLDRVSIDVVSPAPETAVQAVVYEDSNGGSPVDATLAASTTVTIDGSGVFTATFDPPVQINAPVVWVGFYLPVDFEFRADTSGTSVLTYWAWTPGATFDLSNLASAQVLGPADGSAPVNIDMDGVARITAELVTGGQQIAVTPTPAAATTDNGSLDQLQTDGTGRIVQVVGDPNTSLAPMVPYPGGCGFLFFDGADIAVNLRSAVALDCKLLGDRFAPASPDGYFRPTDDIYDITVFGLISPGTNRMPYPITHCLTVQGSNLDRAVLGLAYGAPREWEILPTVRYGSLICADLYYAGSLAFFVPN